MSNLEALHVRAKEVTYWTAVLILLIGFSRIFLGVHYVTDVTGGFLVGGFWLLIGFAVADRNGTRAARQIESENKLTRGPSPPGRGDDP